VERDLLPAEQALTSSARGAAWAGGHALSVEQAVEYALQYTHPTVEVPTRATEPSSDGQGWLTGREREVAALIARGRSNREIADTLVIAPTTAERHVANILHKLELRSRTEVALWAVAHGLEVSTS
jgi:non-specific serine/threonine protein kinase